MRVAFIALFFISCRGTRSIQVDTAFVNNDAFTFKVLSVVKEDSLGDFMYSMYWVDIAFPDYAFRTKLKALPKNKWLQLLENENSDWAANLILYNLYERDAARYTVVHTREAWMYKRKADEIEYWKAHLQ